MLKTIFIDLVLRYKDNPVHAEKLWKEIEDTYSSKSRHYHTLQHLEMMLTALGPIKKQIADWDTLAFTVFYHDFVYISSRRDNEIKSAEKAIEKLKTLGYPTEKVLKCGNQIMATKGHRLEIDPDTNFLTDADLCILGSSWETYLKYTEQIQKEYTFYPEILFMIGRRKVLNHFLDMNRIFKSDYFFARYEQQARQNIEKELHILTA